MVKKLEANQKKFSANGNNYVVMDSIPLARYVIVREAGIKIIEGVDSIFDLIRELKAAYELLNKSKFADSAVKIHNIMTGLNDVSLHQTPAAFIICACMIAKEGEDISDCTQEMIDAKINDWSVEGYDAESFFHLALQFIPGLVNLYKQSSQNTSQTINEVLQEIAKS